MIIIYTCFGERTLLTSRLWRNRKISMIRKLCFLMRSTVKESELFAKPCPKVWQATSMKNLPPHCFSMIINGSQGENYCTLILRYFYWFASFRHTLIIYLGLASFSCSRSRYGHVIILKPWSWCQLSIKHLFYIIWLISIHLARFVLLEYFFSGAASFPCCRSRCL